MMNTQILIPERHPQSEKLSELLASFAGRTAVQHVFLSYSQTAQKHLLILHLSSSHLPDGVYRGKWIRKALHQCKTQVILLGGLDVRKHLRLGSLFTLRHCHASTLIHTSEGHEFSAPELGSQLKKFRQFREAYYHTHDLLSTEISKAENSHSLAMAYHLYTSLFQHHLFYLEFLHLGTYFYQDSLDQRFLRLEPFLPQIRSLMLKKTGTTYFITDALLSVAKADRQQDLMCLKDEFKEAIAETERQLYDIVTTTFREIKKAVKDLSMTPKILIENKTTSPYETVISILTRHFCIEEIFLFYEEEVHAAGQKTQVLYLLLISKKISNQDLFEMMQIVARKTGGTYAVVPIAHSAAWIQDSLWECQSFFRTIMAPEKAIYTAEIPSVIHWHTGEHDAGLDIDLDYHHFCGLHEKYRLVRSVEKPDSQQGTGLILSGIFYRACSVFIYCTLHYRHNRINIRILWKLCEYAEPKIKTLGYLIEKLPFDFFAFLNPSENLHRDAYLLNEDILEVMDELVQSFAERLKEHCKK
ncbi:hypothetical protein [uncultured Chryseobacterium sp.]|uniref:hypothetical protein n=1 Tax=uncultured Chryseobacterium sp. TaxID=259322 RepID=UPI0025E9261F|nr:hypothetical protein [uncultured Chryseobacterium sp.]